ncbi:hypothetical protein Bca52824_035943 [Brassica carinata]|uniref:Pentatricopeptide repeat-containing protein n=1 Tax=Brassica carinata TaxID=52824 RepID=A0A8X7S4L5_BRACI|nr:hypothetical protein Bca52824_035943 [Brassica carinata]
MCTAGVRLGSCFHGTHVKLTHVLSLHVGLIQKKKPIQYKTGLYNFGPTTSPAFLPPARRECREHRRKKEGRKEGETFLTELTGKKNQPCPVARAYFLTKTKQSLLRLGSSILGCFSRVGFSSGVVKQSKRDDYASHEPFGVTDLNFWVSTETGFDMEKSIYNILTIDRWESLNHMDYRQARLRPVHGKLALKFLKWVVKQPGLEPDHLLQLFCITTHILVRARMYDPARHILKELSWMGDKPSFVFTALMTTYRLCNSNPAVFDILIRVYMREGRIQDSLEIFRLMGLYGFNPSVYTCNAMLGSIVKSDGDLSVWPFLKEMLKRKICPDVATFNILINALCAEANFKKSRYLMEKMEKSGYPPTIVTYNTVLHWYCKKGRFKAAIELIDHMKSKGLTLINSRSAKGYLLLRKMRKRMIYPNEVTYNTLINGFSNEGKVLIARQLLDEMLAFGLSPNHVTFNALTDGYISEGNFKEALKMFYMMEAQGLIPTEVSYGVLLDGLCKHAEFDLARGFYMRMKRKGISVGRITYTGMIDGLCKNGLLDEAVKMLNEMSRDGVDPDIVTYSALINGFCKVGRFRTVKEIVCRVYRAGLILQTISRSTYSSLLYVKLVKWKQEEFMRCMTSGGILPNAVSFDCLINGMEAREALKAFSIFDEMTKVGHHPTFFTYGGLLKGLCKGGHLKEAEKFLRSLHDVPAAVDTVMYNTLLTAMCKSGNLDKAVSIWRDGSALLCLTGKTVIATLFAKEAEARGNLLPNQVMYTCFVDGMFKAGQWEAAFHFREQMEKLGLAPDAVTTNVMIDGYSRMGKIEKTNDLLSEIGPNLITYNILLHGYSKRKDIATTFKLYTSMILDGVLPDKLTCHSLILGICESNAGDWS